MGVRLIVDSAGGSDSVAMYCSTSGFAFGPVFDDESDAMDFLEWLPMDARTYSDKDMEEMKHRWLETRAVEA